MSDHSSPSGPPASTPEAPLSVRAKLFGVVAFIALVALIVYAARFVRPEPPAPMPEHSGLQLDLTRPDALIESASLASLPKDLLRIPLLRDALTEDFVFYYETNADRLGIVGSLRRIAYEHDLALHDSLLEELLDQPAEIALWRSADGKLGHALLRLRRGAVAKLLEPLAQVAADDKQLAAVGELDIDGDSAPVYRLRYNHDRTLLLIPHADELLVFSSPQMLQSSDDPASAFGRIAAEQVAALITSARALSETFGLDKRTATHRIVIGADVLALGYGRFAPGLAGVRMEMDDAGWQSWLALDGGAGAEMKFAPLWQAMPMGASACAAAPVSAAALQPLFDKLALPQALAARLDGPVALCWFATSRLHTPLLVTRLAAGDDATVDAQLGEVFERMIGAEERNLDAGAFDVESTTDGKSSQWQRVVGSDFGLHPAKELDDPAQLSSTHFFRVSLARRGDVLAFSLDDALVGKALATLDHRFPPLAETLPKDVEVPVYFAPGSLATLLEQETLQSLPRDIEAVFRNAAETHLLPKLRAMGKHGSYAVTLPPQPAAKGDWTWVPLAWTAL